MRTIISMLLLCAANFAAITIPVEINNWSDVARTNEPVTAGIPLPKGTVYNLSDLRITDASGTTIPAQFKPLSKWWGEKLSGKKSESSIKWVLCDFQTTSTSKGSTPLFVKTDASTVTAPASPINLTETPQEITVITGPIKFTISKTRFNLFDALWINKNGNKLYEDNERLILPGNNNGGFITAGNWTEGECASDIVHKSFKAAPKRVVIEEQGLLKTVIRIEGRYYADSLGVTRGLYGWQCFITAYSGKSFVDVQWALTNDYLEGTKPKEKSAADAHTVYVWPFKSHSLSLNLNLDNASAQTYSLLADNELNGTASTNAATLLQKINSFSTNTGTSGTAAKGGVSLGDGSMGMRAVIRDFAQSSPKRLSVSKNKIDIEFLPDTSGSSPYSLDPFTRDNCRMRFEFFTGNASSGQLNNLYSTFETPLRMVASDRAWYRNTNAWERGFGIPFESTYNRKAPASWTRYTKPTNVNWQNYGQIGEFNGGGDHENLTTCFWKYLLTANPGDFESYESKVLWFNDRVQCHFGYDVWQKFSWFLDPLANMSQYRYCHEMFGTNAYPVIKSFTGYTLSADIAASHFPDDGHMTQLQQIEYYLLTGDLATKDAIENMGARAAGHIYGRVYLLPASYATYKWGSDSAKLDSNFTIPYGPRYVARPSMVANHAYEITGDYKYFYPAKLGTYVLRNVIRRNPIGYLAIAGDELYCSPANTPWATDHPGITIPKYYSGSDFQIGIGMEALYSFLMKTDDEEIRDALIFAGRSMMWRMNQDSLGRWSGFTYSGWSDYGYSGKPYKFKWSLNSDQNGGRGYYSSASEGFGGFIFSYLASGRTDFLPVLKDGWDAWGQKLSDLKAINLYIAMHKRDSLDAVPPSAVQNLTASPSSSGGLQLRWTAPGGNGSSGRAAYYQVKVSKVPMVDIAEKWNQETQTGWPDLRDSLPYTIQALELKAVNYTQKVAKSFWALPNILGEPVPQEAGTSETMNIPDLDTSTTWYAAVVSYDSAGNVSSISNIAASRASAGEKVRDNCTTLSLSANPNPFNPVTKITVSLPATLNPVDRVKLSIFSTDGKLIKTLEDCVVKESSLTTVWNANSANNKNVSSGIYILKLQYGKTVLQKRITLLR